MGHPPAEAVAGLPAPHSPQSRRRGPPAGWGTAPQVPPAGRRQPRSLPGRRRARRLRTHLRPAESCQAAVCATTCSLADSMRICQCRCCCCCMHRGTHAPHRQTLVQDQAVASTPGIRSASAESISASSELPSRPKPVRPDWGPSVESSSCWQAPWHAWSSLPSSAARSSPAGAVPGPLEASAASSTPRTAGCTSTRLITCTRAAICQQQAVPAPVCTGAGSRDVLRQRSRGLHRSHPDACAQSVVQHLYPCRAARMERSAHSLQVVHTERRQRGRACSAPA